MRVAPSLISADWARFGDAARTCVDAGADWLHLDVMDGHFVPNLTFGPDLVRAVRRSVPDDAVLDVHLMVARPDDWIGRFADAGANHLIVHAEASVHLQRTLAAVRAAGCQAGVALNPATPPSVLDYVLGDLDQVLVMTVNPGFGGQRFLPRAGEKVADLARMRAEDGASFLISVDGGVDDKTAPGLARAGADALVAGSFVFGHAGGVAGGIAALRGAVSP